MGKVFLVKAAENTFFYLFTTFFLVFLTQFLGKPRGAGLDALFWGSLLEVPVIMVSAYISDQIGRRPVMFVGVLGAGAAGFLLFALDKSASQSTVLQLVLTALAFHGVIVGGMSAFFAELFPTGVRYTAMSVSYQLASVLGGSVAPIIGTLLIDRTGQPISVPIYATVVAIAALACIVVSRETKGVNLANLRPE